MFRAGKTFKDIIMASRGKKKTQSRGVQTADVVAVSAKRDLRYKYVVAALLVLLTVFLFINSFTVQANITYEDENGNNLLSEVDPSDMTFGKSTVTIMFAPVDGYDDAVGYTLKNLPISGGSELVQQIAKQLLAEYPQSQLDMLDTAYLTIYVTEAVYLAASIAFIVTAITVLVRKREKDDVIALAAASAMTLLSAVRLVIGLIMCMSSTKEFIITAGGAPWLALIATVAATVLLAIVVNGRLKKNKAETAEIKK